MWKNYCKTAFRNFARNKVTTFINVAGLSIGISASLIIFLVIQYDYSFDRYEPDRDRIYRVVSDGDGWKNPGVPSPFHRALQSQVSGIQNTAALFNYNDWAVKVSVPKDNNHPPRIFKQQEKIVFVDSNYFSIFPHQWITGNPRSALQNPYQLVLSEGRARQYFPNLSLNEMVGKTVVFSDTLITTITGIVKDLTANSDFTYQSFISLSTIPAGGLTSLYNWEEWSNTNSNFQTIIKLLPGVAPASVSKQVTAVFKEHKATTGNGKTEFHLQPLSDVHTNPDYEGSVNPETLKNLVILAIFLLLLGGINFINLSTAQASQRAKEIGIRKTLGSNKSQLVFQFLTETFLLTVCTAVISVLITPVLIKAFSGFIPEGLQFDYLFQQPYVLLFLFAVTILVSVMAGLYPAFILSRFRPVSVLKNIVITTRGTTQSAWLRKSLIVFQFVTAQVFIIGMVVVDEQIRYEMSKDMGFRKDAVINFYVPFDFQNADDRKFVLKEKLKAMPEVQEVSLGNQSPAFSGQMSSEIYVKEKGKEVRMDVDTRDGDTSFLHVYNIRLLAGRNIMSPDTTSELLINETLARQLGYQHPADAIGHVLSFGDSPLPIVGVMANFHLASVRSAIRPLIYYTSPRSGYVMHVALQPNSASWNSAISKMQAAWRSLYPDVDFDYTFLDKKIGDFYKADQQLSLLLTWSASVAIFISCLGLLGLVIFITNKRVKEIGVRKVLGASVRQIIALLSADFAKLLALACVIAIPFAWWIMHDWLQGFAYHTELSWWIFAVSAFAMIVIAMGILCLRAGKAAIANPVKSLRAE